MTDIERAYVLYNTLRLVKDRDFKEEDYKWVLGYRVLNNVKPYNSRHLCYPIEPQTLFGIAVEKDIHNPFTFRLYEDITNKIAISYEEFKKMEEQDD